MQIYGHFINEIHAVRTPRISPLEQTDVDRLISALQNSTTLAMVRKYELVLRKLLLAEGTPVIRGVQAHFFFEAMYEASIAAVGDWNNWQNVDKLSRLNLHSSFYHITKEFPIDARFAYRFAVDARDSVLDPLNAYSEQEVFGTNSVLRMPAYVHEHLADEPGALVPRGKIREFAVESSKRSGKSEAATRRNYARKVKVYFPADVRKLSGLPVLYVHDGLETLAIGRFANILDNLFFSEPRLRKCVVVFVPPRERDREYMLHPGFAEWFAHTLVPQVESKFKLSPTAANRGTLGSSLGGLLSAQLGFLYPKVFGAIAAQSPAFWVQSEKITTLYAGIRKLPLRWYMMTGTINDAQTGARNLLRVLQDKGYPVTYRETSQSHNWGNWRGNYPDIIRWFVSEL